MYSVILEEPKNIDLQAATLNLIKVLEIKTKTAKQLISNAPLKVYNQLSPEDAKIMVESLNITTLLHWRVDRSTECGYSKVNWNKTPMIYGKSIEDLKKKNNPEKTGVAFLPGLSNTSNEKSLSSESATFDESLSLMEGLSAGLDEAISTKTDSNLAESSALMTDASNIPGVDQSITLQPGFYNLLLPALKSKNSKKVAEDLIISVLELDPKEVKEMMTKPIVTIAKDVDHIEGSEIMKQFEASGILLNVKLLKKFDE